MRLGDLDALKHKFAQITYIRFTADMGQGGFEMFSEKEIEEIIDNFPTVPLPDFKEGYKQAIIDGKTNFSRPQGEWGKWVISEIRCPNCLEYFQTDCYLTEELKKCPNCGVIMKGGDKNG